MAEGAVRARRDPVAFLCPTGVSRVVVCIVGVAFVEERRQRDVYFGYRSLTDTCRVQNCERLLQTGNRGTNRPLEDRAREGEQAVGGTCRRGQRLHAPD